MPRVTLPARKNFRVQVNPSPGGKAFVDYSAGERVTVLALSAQGVNDFYESKIKFEELPNETPKLPGLGLATLGAATPQKVFLGPKRVFWRSENKWTDHGEITVPTTAWWFLIIINQHNIPVDVDYSVRF